MRASRMVARWQYEKASGDDHRSTEASSDGAYFDGDFAGALASGMRQLAGTLRFQLLARSESHCTGGLTPTARRGEFGERLGVSPPCPLLQLTETGCWIQLKTQTCTFAIGSELR